MNATSLNNKRIAKNTLILYARMLFLMLVSLYTSRVILNSLGVEDYGIYNVVGGVVTMFSMLTGSLSAAISRFITFELGTGNKDNLKKIFSSSITIQAAIALVIAVLVECIGSWFLNAKMEIPEGRLVAANWCLQFSIITFAINLINVPYHASIIAHERMSAFAYMSILEAMGKLIIAWCISINPIDRLIFYGLMLTIISCIIRAIYAWYCKHNFEECTYRFVYDPGLLKRMFSFAGWNFLGAGSAHLMNQGVNLLSNVYFGVTVNAARGIAVQVDHAIMQFVNNFTTAVNPQITKSYASNQKDYMFSLIFRGAKYSYFLVLLFAIPILCETPIILKLWLKIVPDYTVNFVRLAIIISMILVLSKTMVTAMLATGDIKKYQIIVGGLGMLVFPMAWGFFSLGFSPEMAYVSVIIIFICQWVCRLFLLREMTGMSIKCYFQKVMYRVLLTTSLAFPIPIALCSMLDSSIFRAIIVTILSIFLTSAIIIFCGMDKEERRFLYSQISLLSKKIKK